MRLDKVLDLPGGIIIWFDKRNWVLEWGGKNNRWYYCSLDELCEGLLEIRLRVGASEARKIKGDVRNLLNMVRDVRELVGEDIVRVFKAGKKADRKLSNEDLVKGGR